METLSIKTRIQISRLIAEVFEAIADPEKMKHYFISRGSGRMEEGKVVEWSFPEFEGSFPVQIGKVQKPSFIGFTWKNDSGKELTVEIHLEEKGTGSTLVTVEEKSMPNNDEGIQWLQQNTEGWANFLAFLKAYVEHGINLRIGAFDFLKDNKQ